MAPGRLSFCSSCAVLLLLLLADYVAAADSRLTPETTSGVTVGASGSWTQELVHRQWTDHNSEVRSYDDFQEFERRELATTDYPYDPADPNCQNDPTLCTDP